MISSLSVSLDDARRVISAAEAKATELALPCCVAVVDAGNNPVAQIRMDGALLGSVQVALDKAFTAKAFDMSTADLAANAQPGQQFYGIHVAAQGRIMIFAGGVPLVQDGTVVGAVGVSGGSGEQDQAIADAAAAAL
jgi:uncharacterized protein GlcG (DUF336 family)